jgi:hypothetical protein
MQRSASGRWGVAALVTPEPVVVMMRMGKSARSRRLAVMVGSIRVGAMPAVAAFFVSAPTILGSRGRSADDPVFAKRNRINDIGAVLVWACRLLPAQESESCFTCIKGVFIMGRTIGAAIGVIVFMLFYAFAFHPAPSSTTPQGTVSRSLLP